MLRSVVSLLWVASLAVLVTPAAHAQSTTDGAGAAAVDPRDEEAVDRCGNLVAAGGLGSRLGDDLAWEYAPHRAVYTREGEIAWPRTGDVGMFFRGVALLDERIVVIGRHFADVRFAGASTGAPMGASDLWLGALE